MLPIRTERLVLRRFVLEDAAPFAAYRSEPEVARYQSWDAPYSLESARGLIGEMMGRGALARAGEWNQIAIELAGGEEALIGDCAFRVMATEARTAQIGFTLATRYWGKGYATEAARALIEGLLEKVGVEHVVADCDAENAASQRVLERVGMRRVEEREVVFKGAVGREWRYEVART